jgi:hypothetical protein
MPDHANPVITRGTPCDKGNSGDIRAIWRSLNENISDTAKTPPPCPVKIKAAATAEFAPSPTSAGNSKVG